MQAWKFLCQDSKSFHSFISNLFTVQHCKKLQPSGYWLILNGCLVLLEWTETSHWLIPISMIRCSGLFCLLSVWLSAFLFERSTKTFSTNLLDSLGIKRPEAYEKRFLNPLSVSLCVIIPSDCIYIYLSIYVYVCKFICSSINLFFCMYITVTVTVTEYLF